MANHIFLVFSAFLLVLQTFHGRRRRRVMPFHPIEIAGGNPVQWLFSIIMVMAWRQRFPRRMAFKALVDLLTPFLHSTTIRFIGPPIPIRKQVKLVLYRVAYGVSCARMYNLYGCGESTIHKYNMIVCRALGTSEGGLFLQFIHTPQGDRLQNIIESFWDIIGLSNIAGAINGTYIPLSMRSSKQYTPMPSDFFNRKKFYSIVLQRVCDLNKMFWNVCAGKPGGCMTLVNFLYLLLLPN